MMYKNSSEMPLSIRALYTLQDKFIELKFFTVALVVWFGFLLFYYDYSISIWGGCFLGIVFFLIFNCIRNVKKNDLEFFPKQSEDWLVIRNNGQVYIQQYLSPENTDWVVDDTFFQVKFSLLPSVSVRDVAPFWKSMENVHLLSMNLKTPNHQTGSSERRVFYYSRRMFLLPHLYEFAKSAGKRVGNLDFMDKVEIDPLKFKGQDFITNAVRNDVAEASLKPPFLANAGRITGLEDGLLFATGRKRLTAKYENLKIYAYPSTIDEYVDYEIFFQDKHYMFKLTKKFNRHLIPHYETKYESKFDK